MIEHELKPHAERLLLQVPTEDRQTVQHSIEMGELAWAMWCSAADFGARNDPAAATALQAYIDSNPNLPETTIEGAEETIALLRQAA